MDYFYIFVGSLFVLSLIGVSFYLLIKLIMFINKKYFPIQKDKDYSGTYNKSEYSKYDKSEYVKSSTYKEEKPPVEDVKAENINQENFESEKSSYKQEKAKEHTEFSSEKEEKNSSKRSNINISFNLSADNIKIRKGKDGEFYTYNPENMEDMDEEFKEIFKRFNEFFDEE